MRHAHAPGEDRVLGARVELGRACDSLLRNAARPGERFRILGGEMCTQGLEPGAVRLDEGAVDRARLEDLLGDCREQGDVCAGLRLQIEARHLVAAAQQ